MATAAKKSSEKTKSKQTVKSDASTSKRSLKEEDILKRTPLNITTPRSFVQKSSTVDIYGQKKTAAPKKQPGTTHGSNTTPSKEFLKESPSSISVKSAYDKTPRAGAQKKSDPKITAKTSVHSARTEKLPRTAKDLPFSNVTVNSPVAKRKITSNNDSKTESKNNIETNISKRPSSTKMAKGDPKDITERQRTKTRTLNENEVKVLKSEAIDNAAEMKNLAQKLIAKPKAFYVEIDDDKSTKKPEKQSDEEMSYEDDFESYESDFESYHSEHSQSKISNHQSDGNTDSDRNDDFDKATENKSVCNFDDDKVNRNDGIRNFDDEKATKNYSRRNFDDEKALKNDSDRNDNDQNASRNDIVHNFDDKKARRDDGRRNFDDERATKNYSSRNDYHKKARRNDGVRNFDDKKVHRNDGSRNFDDQKARRNDSVRNDNDQKASRNDCDRNDDSKSNDGQSYDDLSDTFGEVVKESKDEEKMLDSGNFELRDRSATKFRPTAMAFISEDSEDDGKPSLTDEGFQEMSTSSAGHSMKTHVDVLDRPLFIDFSKSKENKRKRKLNERLQQRAKDLLSMITLHQMSYLLFEMKPIPYDLYMATFGRSNYTQIAVQTFDDGITEEIQTEEIVYDHKWTQHPVDFSKHDIYLYPQVKDEKYAKNNEDYLSRFSFLINKNLDDETNNKINLDKNYKENPLRIYFEQKDGVGSCEMLPYEKYKKKVKENDFNVLKLNKFLKKAESRVSNILIRNSGDKNITDLAVKSSKLPFSKGYTTILPNTAYNEELPFLKSTKITSLIFSETKSNLIMSVHSKPSSNIGEKCVISLWDVSVTRRDPVKILTAVDNVNIGRFKGNTDGIFVAALTDGSLHLWDLSEQPTWRSDVASDVKTSNLVEVYSDELSQTEKDREWNFKNSNVGKSEQPLPFALQACSYTSSASNMAAGDVTDHVVGLEFVGEAHSLDGGRKIVGQICSLQRIGMLTIWSIIQDRKTAEKDKGKAYWSKMTLEKSHSINLLDHIDIPTNITQRDEKIETFNLNAAKRRLSGRKSQKIMLKKEFSRPKSAISSDFDISRPTSAASLKKVLSVEKKYHENWESGVVCCDLKIMCVDKKYTYLVAKNRGEVLCCTKFANLVKVKRFCVTDDSSTITCLDVSPHGLSYFLAATNSGTVSLCSLLDGRVLLTLDCRNVPATQTEVCQADHKGRFLASAVITEPTTLADDHIGSKLCVMSVHWSATNPCCLWGVTAGGDVTTWDLRKSDISAVHRATRVAVCAAHANGSVAILTPAGEIQIHRLKDTSSQHHLELFHKYVTLL